MASFEGADRGKREYLRLLNGVILVILRVGLVLNVEGMQPRQEKIPIVGGVDALKRKHFSTLSAGVPGVFNCIERGHDGE